MLSRCGLVRRLCNTGALTTWSGTARWRSSVTTARRRLTGYASCAAANVNDILPPTTASPPGHVTDVDEHDSGSDLAGVVLRGTIKLSSLYSCKTFEPLLNRTRLPITFQVRHVSEGDCCFAQAASPLPNFFIVPLKSKQALF